jgi:hypothetical protein
MIEPATYNTQGYQGATYKLNMTYSLDGSPVNLSGFTATMQVGGTSSTSTPVLELSTASEIVLGGAAGTIAVTVSSTAMTAVAANNYLYEFDLNSGSEIVKLLRGSFVVVAEITT